MSPQTPHGERRLSILPLRPLFPALMLLASIGGALSRTGTAAGRDLAAELQMHYMHQYLGNASDDYDCGPTSVAMVLDAYGLRPRGVSDAAFVASVRRTMGVPGDIGTLYSDLERAFDAYGLRYTLNPSTPPAEPYPEMQPLRCAIGP